MPKTTSSSQNSQSQKIRRKQIDKLKQQKLNVIETQRDVQYRVDFLLKRESMIYSIIIDLPPAFPSEAPMLFVHPPCSHKYLDAAQVVVKFPPLENFKSKPDLAYVIKRLISEFEKNPPSALLHPGFSPQPQDDEFPTQTYFPQYPKLEELTSSLTNVESSPTPPQSTGPDLPEIIPELEDLTTEELKDLLSDEIQLVGLYHQTEMSKKLQKDRDEISQRIEEIANQNLSNSKKLEETREKLMKSFDQCQKLKEEYDKNMERYMEASEWLSLSNLSLTLEVSAAEGEEKSEKIAEEFLEGNMDVNEFTKEFVKMKSLATTRKIKEDKIRHIITSS